MEKLITKNMVINTVGSELEKEFSANGFKFVKSKKHLIRKYKGGFDKIGFSTYDMYPVNHQVLSIWFQKRLDVVEKTVNKFYDKRFMNPAFLKSTVTVYPKSKLSKGIYNNNFKSEDSSNCEICAQSQNNKAEGFILHTENDINRVSDFIKPYINDKILSFFDINNDLDYVNKNQKGLLLKTFDSRGWVDPLSFMRCLVLMKLTNDSSYQTIKEEYINRMIVPANPDVNVLEIEVAKELIDYLEISEL